MGKSKKSLPGGAGQRDLSKNAIKKGHGLKTVVSDFLPEVWSQSVRFTLIYFNLKGLSSGFRKYTREREYYYFLFGDNEKRWHATDFFVVTDIFHVANRSDFAAT